MSMATWGDAEAQSEKSYPTSLLKQLLQQMMTQFAAQGACLALYEPHLNQLMVRLHVRLHPTAPLSNNNHHETELTSLALGRLRRLSQPLQPINEVEDVPPAKFELFYPGKTYARGEDFIGYCWQEGKAYILPFDDYLNQFHANRKTPFQLDLTPGWLLVAPLQIPFITEEQQHQPRLSLFGVVLLYQNSPGIGFQPRQRSEATQFAERMALYIENHALRRTQSRTSDYMQQLMHISTTFPTTVKLADLFRDINRFATNVVDFSSLLITLFDRDRNKIYDVYAIANGTQIKGLPTTAAEPDDRPQWWRIIQKEQQTIVLAPTTQDCSGYEELLDGIWGNQRNAQSFLLLPMKIFKRVIGTICLTSTHPHAYHADEIQVLETMVQIITVGIENIRLYQHVHQTLEKSTRREQQLSALNDEARQREELLAAMNSALLSITSVIDITELLHKFVQSIARLVETDMCTFFQLSPDKEQLVAQAIYAPTTRLDDQGEAPSPGKLLKQDDHPDLIGKIHLPYKNSILEQLTDESFHYLDDRVIEELTQVSDESGVIFLRETNRQKLLMIPVRYQTEVIGILTVHADNPEHKFRPKQVGMLLALCAQAAVAIRNAEDFAELQHMVKLKDEFLVTASHELRTPLSAITGYSTLLKRQGTRITPQQVMKFATKIVAASQQLTDLVANMTEAAKLGVIDKKLELQMGPVQLQATAEMAANILSINIEQKITMDVPAELWATGDPLHVRQVITNLLDNAAKYSAPSTQIRLTAEAKLLSHMPEEQQNYALTTQEAPDPEVILVSVQDEGEGIQPEDQQRIFEKFVRGTRSLTTTVRGSGLGLYICRRYIEAMGGRLWLHESTPRGSVFCFYLQRVQAPVNLSRNYDYETTDTIS